MIIAITAASFICLLFVFLKYEWGVSLYLLLFFLVPFYFLYLGGFVIGENLMHFILLIVLLFWITKKGGIKTSVFLMSPFLFLFISLAILSLFAFSNMPFVEQFKRFRIDIIRLFLPFVILCLVTFDKRNSTRFTKVMYIVIAVSTLYGIYLIPMLGNNPYIEAINPILKYNIGDQEQVFEEGVRLFGYISSVYPHVTEFGYFLVFSSVFLLYQFKRDKTIIPKILLGLVMICIIVCGSRSVFLAEGVVVVSFLFYKHQFLSLPIISVILAFAWILMIHFSPDYMLFIRSIGDESLAEGSSIGLRMSQFEGCFDALNDNPLFGHGYGWSSWYRMTIGRHPTMLSFESCLIQILNNNGILGVIVWLFFAVFLIKNTVKFFNHKSEIKTFLSLLLIAYFGYTFFTGDYGTFRVMSIFYALIVSNEMSYHNELNKKVYVPKIKGTRYNKD